MRPDFEDLKRRINSQEKEVSKPSEAHWYKKDDEKVAEEGKSEPTHPHGEELCGYADGTLRRKDLVEWTWVDKHVQGCQDCKDEVMEISSAVPLLRRTIGVPWNGWVSPTQILVGAEALVIVILLGFLLFQQDEYVERQSQLRMEVKDAIAEGFRDATSLLVRIARPQADEVLNAVQQFHVVKVSTEGITYPFPTLRVQPKHAAAIAEGLRHFPDLRAEYDEYLKRWSDIIVQLGDVLVETGKTKDAIRVFDFLTKETQDKALLYGLAELYKMDSRHHDAISIYEDMIARGWAKNDPRPWHYAGFSYEELGEFEKALKYYDKALSIFPEYAKVFYNKAHIYFKLSSLSPQEKERLYRESLQKALELTLKAYKKDDSNPRISFTLAILYAEQRDWNNSLEYMERAIQMDRAYVIRAEKERAFTVFRDRSNEPHHAHFVSLLDRYWPARGKFSAELRGEFDPKSFPE